MTNIYKINSQDANVLHNDYLYIEMNDTDGNEIHDIATYVIPCFPEADYLGRRWLFCNYVLLTNIFMLSAST